MLLFCFSGFAGICQSEFNFQLGATLSGNRMSSPPPSKNSTGAIGLPSLSSDTSAKAGKKFIYPSVGFNWSRMFSNHSAVQIGLQFQGVSYSANYDNPSFRLGYLAIPLNYSYSIARRVKLMAGPYAGFMISSSGKDGFSLKNLNRLDYGGSAGVEIKITSAFSTGIKYFRSIENVADFSSTKNKAIQFYLSYQLIKG